MKPKKTSVTSRKNVLNDTNSDVDEDIDDMSPADVIYPLDRSSPLKGYNSCTSRISTYKVQIIMCISVSYFGNDNFFKCQRHFVLNHVM